MDQNRSNWYILTGLILGLAMGLLYTWVISPIEEVDTHPHLLREDYQDIYRALIARAYQANNNLPRAEARLELINDEDPALALAAQAQRYLAEGGDVEIAKVLANLSAALQSAAITAATPSLPPTEVGAQFPGTENPQTTLTATLSGEAPSQGTSTPGGEGTPDPGSTPTESPPFILQDSSPICDPTLGEPLIQVIATNNKGEGVPGVALEISLGPDLTEIFYTGLKPEVGLGYADFLAEPGLTYTLEVPESGLMITDIEVPTCLTETETSYWGSWEVYITYPN